MAFDPKPSTWIANWREDGTDITVPIASFAELTAAEADATTGDIRKVLFAINEQLYTAWNNTATADRPTQMTIYKSTSVDNETGEKTEQYTFRFITEVLTQEVMDEPS